MMRTLGLVSLVLAFASVAHADPAPRFDIARLSVDGNVLSTTPSDLDGDGKLDLVAIYEKNGDETRHAAIFWNRGGSFPASPDLTIALDGKACAYDVADVDGAPGAELLTLARDGVRAIHFASRHPGAATLIITEGTAFYSPDTRSMPRVPLVLGLGRERRLIVPLLGAFGVYTRDGARWTPTVHLELEGKGTVTLDERVTRPTSGSASFGITYQVPDVHVLDTNHDGLRDIVLTREDRVAIFRQRAGGTFDAHASYYRDFAVRSNAESERAVQSVHTGVTDFDGDGIADLVITKVTGKGLMSATTTAFLYLGRASGGFPDAPDQILKLDGLSDASFEPMDLTGDGHPDLVVPTITMGVWAIIRMLTTKMVTVKMQVFAFGNDHRFAVAPIQRELKFKISLSGEADLPAIDVHGDYNGDRRPDLAFGITDGELAIFAGVPDEVVTKEPVEHVKVEARGRLDAVDLDHKGKDDIVLSYPFTAGHRHEIVVLRNRGTW